MLRIKIEELGSIEDSLLDFAVIVANHKQKNVFVRHKKRTTFEIPGGKRESDESIIDCAKRELQEETGAKQYLIVPMFIYSVESEKMKDYGQVFYAEIESFSDKLEFEISERILLEGEPEEYTYPQIQPIIFKEMKERIDNGGRR